MTRSTEQIEWTRVETSEGVIFFYVTNVYTDGKLSDVRFDREDNRTSVYMGNINYRYSNRQSYNNAIKRANKIN